MTFEEAQAPPDVVTAMSFFILSLLSLYMLMFCVCSNLGMFLVNEFLNLVLFYSGSTRLFVSLSLN